MACVTGLLPVEQGVAAWAALRRDAEAIKAAGDDRGLGQLMAALPAALARELVLGQGEEAGGTRDTGGDRDARGDREEDRSGPRTWLRRIFTDPAGRVVAVDPHRRHFPAAVRRLLRARHNQTKARPGWRARAVGEGQAPDIETVTPTGHRHRSPAPPVQEVFTADPELVEYLDTG